MADSVRCCILRLDTYIYDLAEKSEPPMNGSQVHGIYLNEVESDIEKDRHIMIEKLAILHKRDTIEIPARKKL